MARPSRIGALRACLSPEWPPRRSAHLRFAAGRKTEGFEVGAAARTGRARPPAAKAPAPASFTAGGGAWCRGVQVRVASVHVDDAEGARTTW